MSFVKKISVTSDGEIAEKGLRYRPGTNPKGRNVQWLLCCHYKLRRRCQRKYKNRQTAMGNRRKLQNYENGIYNMTCVR